MNKLSSETIETQFNLQYAYTRCDVRLHRILINDLSIARPCHEGFSSDETRNLSRCPCEPCFTKFNDEAREYE